MHVWMTHALGTLLLWGMWGFLAKIASDHLTARSAAFAQGLGGIAVTIVLLGLIRFRPEFHTSGSLVAFLAGVALWLGIITFSFALSTGGKASIVVPLTALYPVVTIVLGVAILKEQLTPINGLGIVFALVAVILLTR